LPMVDSRAKKIGFGWMAHDLLRSQGRAAWRGLRGPERLGALGLVRGDLVESWMDQYFLGRQVDALQAWLFLSAEMWLRARAGKPSVNTNGGSSNGTAHI